jgi:hypothetical protein
LTPGRHPRDRKAGHSFLGWLALFLLLSPTLLPAGVSVPASPAHLSSTDEVEAAYLFNFGKFVRWPEGSVRGPMSICVVGEPPLAETLKRLVSGEQIDGHPVEVRTVLRPEAESGCDVLYLGGGAHNTLEAFVRAAERKPILTVSDAPEFLDHGGILQFLLVEDHVRFAVNLDTAGRSGLSLSSELLKVAVKVRGTQSSGGAH